MISCFVTGIPASATLLHALARHHQRVIGVKPVAAGVVPMGHAWVDEDVLALRAASTIEVPAELDNPVLLADPFRVMQGMGRTQVIDFLTLGSLRSPLTRFESATRPVFSPVTSYQLTSGHYRPDDLQRLGNRR